MFTRTRDGAERQVRQHRGHRAARPPVPSTDFLPQHGRARPMLRRGTLPCSSHCSSPSLSWPISSDRQTPALSPPQSPCPAKHTKRIHYPMGDRKEGPGGGNRHRTMCTSGVRGRPYCVWAGRAGTHGAGPSMAALCLSPPSPWESLGVPRLGSAPAARLGQHCQHTLAPVLLGSSLPIGHPRERSGVLEGLSFQKQSERADGCPLALGMDVRGEHGCWGQQVFGGLKS